MRVPALLCERPRSGSWQARFAEKRGEWRPIVSAGTLTRRESLPRARRDRPEGRSGSGASQRLHADRPGHRSRACHGEEHAGTQPAEHAGRIDPRIDPKIEPKENTLDKACKQDALPALVERRGAQRTSLRVRGVGTFVDASGAFWMARVTLIETSEGGAAVRCPVPIKPLARYTILLDDRAHPEHEREFTGRVVNAKGRGGSYRLGLRCQSPPSSIPSSASSSPGSSFGQAG